MANIKISELDELVNVADNDYLPIVDTSENETKKVAIQRIGAGGKSGDTLPIGSIVPYGNETAPANWLICDGSAISRTTYADLFAVIGTNFGSGDGSTTFNLPNMKGKVAVGLNSNDNDFNTIGKTGGEKTHTLTVDEMPSNIIDTTSTDNNSDGYIARGGYTADGTYNIGGQSQPHNNLQPYQVQNYIIKAFQSAGVIGNVVKVKTNSDTDTYSCNYINNVMQNNILGVSLTADVDPQISTYVEINTWEQQLKIGDKLNVENGKIKIGAGVNYIKIYGQLGIISDGDALFYMWLKKNGNNVGVWEVNKTFNTYAIIPINQILQVEEGDIISIATYQDTQYTIEINKTEVYFEAIYR